MKKGEYLLILFLTLLTLSAYAVHDSTASLVSYTSQYETKDVLFNLQVQNSELSADIINEINVETTGISFRKILDPSSWQHTNDSTSVTWNSSSGLDPEFIGFFKLNTTLDKVDENI